jgi:hypothetical protein
VGEIYDEDDDEEEIGSGRAIAKRSNGSFRMKGSAELDDVCEALAIDRDALAAMGEYSTVGGLICSISLPQGAVYERYLGILCVIATTTVTAGAINAWLSSEPYPAHRAYPDAMPV